MPSLLNPGVWLAAILALALSFGAGWMEKGKRVDAENAIAAQKAEKEKEAKERSAEAAITATANQFRDQMEADRKRSENEMSLLRKRLAAMPTCGVAGDTVGMLFPSGNVNMPGNSGFGLGSVRPTTFADSTCAEQLELAARNYREVCQPNAQQVMALQNAYNAIREKFNTKK